MSWLCGVGLGLRDLSTQWVVEGFGPRAQESEESIVGSLEEVGSGIDELLLIYCEGN